MHLSPPIEPMLARPVTALPAPGARPMLFEQKADGFRVLVFTGPQPYVQSRRGADLRGAFPELVQAAAELGVEAVLDAELVVWGARGLDFPALQERARRRGATAQHAARERPTHLIVFDVLEMSGVVLLDEPLRRRRAALEDLFVTRRLTAPWALCPQTSDPATAAGWLDPVWGAAGIEGVVANSLLNLRVDAVQEEACDVGVACVLGAGEAGRRSDAGVSSRHLGGPGGA